MVYVTEWESRSLPSVHLVAGEAAARVYCEAVPALWWSPVSIAIRGALSRTTDKVLRDIQSKLASKPAAY